MSRKINPFEKIEQVSNLMKVDLDWDSACEKSWGKLFHSGECSLYHYQRFLFYVMIYIRKNHNNEGYHVRIWYQTIDDGDFGAWLELPTLKDAEYIYERVTQVYESFNGVLPTDSEVNMRLKDYGLVVEYE